MFLIPQGNIKSPLFFKNKFTKNIIQSNDQRSNSFSIRHTDKLAHSMFKSDFVEDIHAYI